VQAVEARRGIVRGLDPIARGISDVGPVIPGEESHPLDRSCAFAGVDVQEPTEIRGPGADHVEVATGKCETVMMLSEEASVGRLSVLGVAMREGLRTAAYAAWDYNSVQFLVKGR
jgi:hypothetical protein